MLGGTPQARRLSLILVLALAGCGGAPSIVPPPAATPDMLSVLRDALRQRTSGWIRSWSGRMPPGPWDGTLERVELSQFSDDPDLYVALFDWEARWWGDFVVFCVADGKLQWTAAVSEEERPGANFGFSARGLRLPGFPNPLVEVLWSSHRGNGNLYLYELRERRLHLLFKATAVRSGSDHGSRYRGGALTPSYEDIDGDGIADLTLSGSEDEVKFDPYGSPDPWPTISSRIIRQTFVWNPRSRTFEHRGS